MPGRSLAPWNQRLTWLCRLAALPRYLHGMPQQIKGVLEVHLPVGTRATAIDLKIFPPSSEPRSFSLERSGCGIIPSTFRPSSQIPAMLSSDPLGLGFRCDLSIGRGVAEDDPVLPLQRLQRLRIAIIVAFHMADGNPEHFAGLTGMGEWSVGVVHAQIDELADVLQNRRYASARREAARPHRESGKPCRCPITSPPEAANFATSCMMGANLAMAPVRR